MIEFRPATRADFDRLLDKPLPYRVRAIACVCGDRLLGVGGLGFLPDGTVAGFVMADDEVRHHKLAMHKTALRVLADAKQLGIRRVVALADEHIERAIPWLERLGFEPRDVSGERVWVWQTP